MTNYTLNGGNSNKNSAIKISDFETDCRKHMTDNLLPLPYDISICADGKIHRYSADTKANEKDEWFAAYTDEDSLTVVYGSWSQWPLKHVYKSYDDKNEDLESKIKRREKYELQRKEVEETYTIAVERSAKKAQEEWEQASISSDGFDLGYPNKKGLAPIGLRFTTKMGNPTIIVPMTNIDGVIKTLQYIFFDKSTGTYLKRFMGYGSTKGKFHCINNELLEDGNDILIGEGWATCSSIYGALKNPNTKVVAAMSKGNIENVVVEIMTKFKRCSITIAGDADKDRESVTNVAKKYGLKLVFPVVVNGKDFNDLHSESGIDEVRAQLKTAQYLDGHYDLKTVAQKYLETEDLCKEFDLDKMPKAIKDYVLNKIDSAYNVCSVHPLLITNSLLCTISAFINTRYYTSLISNKKLYPNLWTLSMAPSGTGKSTALVLGSILAKEKDAFIFDRTMPMRDAIKGMTGIAKQIEESKILATEAKSPTLSARCTTEGLLKRMSYGQKGCMYVNEYQAWVSNMDKPYNQDLKSTLTELYDYDGTFSNSLADPDKRVLIKQPFLSVCAYSTKEWVQASFKLDDIASGWFPRFLIFNVTPTKIDEAYESKSSVSDFEMRIIMETLKEDRCYTFEHDAWLHYKKIRQSIDNMHTSYDSKYHPILDNFCPRWKIYLVKLALLLQVAENPQINVITEKALEGALSILTCAIHSTLHMLQSELNLSDSQRQLKNLLKYIRTQVAIDPLSFVPKSRILASGILPGGIKCYEEALKMLEGCAVITKQESLGYTITYNDLNF